MKRSAWMIICLLGIAIITASCSQSEDQEAGHAEGAFPISIMVNQVGEIPPIHNVMEKAIEAYTNTNLQIQWVPFSAYDEKVKVMIASEELPKLLKLTNSPEIIATLKTGQFWEIGPYLSEYPHLSAVNRMYYDNIAVGGKIYGIPLFRDFGRATIQYRKDWLEQSGLELPTTLDDWYAVIKALHVSDPDGNGKKDTYGLVMDKRYNQDSSSLLTRFSVSQGGPNKWEVHQGHFTPEFLTAPFFDTMKLFRRLYEEELINQDFAIVDNTETSKLYESGRAGIQIVGGLSQSWQDKLSRIDPQAVVDVAPVSGPYGIRVPGEPGNVGMMVIPKKKVKTEQEMKKILTFLDKLMAPEGEELLTRGIQNRHWVDRGAYAEVLDRALDAKEVKPYRDSFPILHTDSDEKPLQQPALLLKNLQIVKENESYIVPNPALTLESVTNDERGKELDTIITDAQTKYIMGKIDDEGWRKEIVKWRNAGGDQLIREYEESYRKRGK